jgi:membrane associated rhomboid family serine protease
MIPLTVDVPMKRLPWVNWLLITVTVAISLAIPYREEASVIAGAHEKLSPLVLQRGTFAFAPYQLVTSLFQHADWLHLAGNMLFLFVFGNAINAKLGHLGLLASYLGIGALVNLVWLGLSRAPAYVGASAAIMGMCGMFLVLYPLNSVLVLWDEWLSRFRGAWTAELPGWAVVLLFLAFDVWGALVDRKSGIGYVSHIVGLLLGTTLAVTLLKGGWLSPDPGEQTLLQCLAGEGSTERPVRRRAKQRRKKERL